ncbi:unnamed protein product [Anisakis simplex]|uniref:Uncharacterized protein n=1 Tax=Anisakis simplex TaxID=6269 RepID=A0A0M3K1Y5_ANISI|nr:unnamed protein product [Anisakis simplex]
MIYSQAFRNEKFSPAVALFSAAGLIRTTAGIQPSSAEHQKVARITGEAPRHVHISRQLSSQTSRSPVTTSAPSSAAALTAANLIASETAAAAAATSSSLVTLADTDNLSANKAITSLTTIPNAFERLVCPYL